MKKILSLIILCVMLISLIGCDIEPIFTVYGDIVHQSVQKHYDNYEILELYMIRKDGAPTLHHLCIVNDMQDSIDVMCITYKYSEIQDDYISIETVICDNVELGKNYSTDEHFNDVAVEYVICEKKDIPEATLQSERFKFNEKTLYLCIMNVTNLE